MTPADLIPPDAPSLLRTNQLAELLNVSYTTIRNWVKEGRLPKPIQFSSRLVMFSTQELREALRIFGQPREDKAHA